MLPRDPFLALRQVPFWSIIILLAPLILYLFAHGKSKRKEKTMSLPPSPLRLPLIGHLHQIVKEPQRTLQRLAHRLGPVIYLQLGGVPAVVVSSPEAAKEVLKILDVHCCNRPSSPGAKMLNYNYRDIAFSPYSERWRERCKLFISQLVGSKRAQSFSYALEEQVEQLIQSLSNLPSTEPINFNEKIYALIDGFMGTMAFGRMNGAKLLKYNKFQQDAFIGATSTSSATLLWAMSELIKNPRVMSKVQSEIRSSVHNKQRLQVRDTPKLRYLRMVIKETLRLHPPAPFLVPRESMQHVNLLGCDVPPKTRIFVNVWAIGRDTTCWKGPEEFRPERFEDVDIDFQRFNFELLPFGAGRRMCPAILMGVMNVEFTLASLLHSFDWKLP